MSEEQTLQPGDIFLTKGPGFFSWLIRFGTRHLGEARTKVNHVGLIVVGGPIRVAVAVEALRKVKRRSLWAGYAGTRHEVAIFRPKNLMDDEVKRVVGAAESYVDREYGYGKIALHALDWMLQGAYVFRRLGRMDNYPICSWLVAHAYAKVGKYFDCEPGAAAPDDIWDFCNGSPGKYEKVRSLSPISDAGS